MFKTILAHFVELAQKLLIIYFMNVFIVTSFGRISKKNWFALSRKHVEFSLQDVLIGKLDEVSDLLHHLIIAKWHIWTSRKRSLSTNITVFEKND